MKVKTILIITIVMYALFVAAKYIISAFPNDNMKLKSAQENYISDIKPAADNMWAYYIINKDNPLSSDFTVGLEKVQGGYMLDERCADYAVQMINDAEKDGIKLNIVSAYRSVQRQQENLDAYIERMMEKGHTRKEAEAIAKKEIALPYTSEHNAGLALDILTENWWDTHDDVTDDFENTPEFEWLYENSYKYGFIMRYPKEYENVTGIIYEPWHYRFVGLYYAEKIKESGLPLEYFYKTNF